MNLLIGADPELFVKQNNNYVSAHGLIPGNKNNPHPVPNGAVQVDGMALEFNIDPADSEDGFIFNLTSVMQQLRELTPGYDVVADAVARFSPEYIEAQPEIAKQLGCEPDFNAWTGEMNEKPDVNLPIRTAAGHVHIGFTEHADGDEHFEVCCKMTQQLDFYLGLPSVLFDDDQERRQMYGCAGAFRPKPYGLEYRVLSNAWLRDERLMRWVFKATQASMMSLRHGLLTEKYGDIQHIINNGDRDAARSIINETGLPIPEGI